MKRLPEYLPSERERERDFTMLKAETYPMNGGDGPLSYAQNSRGQREALVNAKSMIQDFIMEKLDMDKFSDNNTITLRIADFGCSIGPNTFIAMKNITEALQHKFQTLQDQENRKTLEFHIFFNDHVNNDFNTLFKNLPNMGKQVFSSGLPGSFHERLLPKSTLHIGFSFAAVHWLSRVPEEVMERNSNKGRIVFTGNDEVYEAFAAQFKSDMGRFLSARAEEMVVGGLLLVVLPGCDSRDHFQQTYFCLQLSILGSCLMDLVKMGKVSEEKVDSFNLPIFITSPSELKEIIETNGNYSIEKMESVPARSHMTTSDIRAALEGLLTQHFGENIIDNLFQLHAKKMEHYSFSDFQNITVISAFLKLI